jgi:hypothetical protein
MTTAANPLDLGLIDLTDVELLRRAWDLAKRVDGKLDPDDSDELGDLLEEISERFAPAANRELCRETYSDNPGEYADHSAFLARQAFRRTYGADFEGLVRSTTVPYKPRGQ